MKVAVTSKGKDLESEVDPRFGRAAYVLVVDPDSMNFTVLDNSENLNALKGAGINAAAMVSESGAEALLTGFCGPNAFKTLNAANIKVANNASGSVRSAVEAFKNGELAFADSANVEGHW